MSLPGNLCRSRHPMGTVMSRLSRARTALRGGIRHPKGSFDERDSLWPLLAYTYSWLRRPCPLAVKHAGCATLAAGILAQSGSFFLTWFGCGTAVCGSRGRDRGRRAPATGAAHDPRFVTPAWRGHAKPSEAKMVSGRWPALRVGGGRSRRTSRSGAAIQE